MKNEAQQSNEFADITEKRKLLDQPRPALEVQKLKSFFDFSIWTEVTRGLGAAAGQKRRKRSALIKRRFFLPILSYRTCFRAHK
ncbi:hypothetical protein [Cytobacillus oceanisediminis]|uniref:hypothetical protein n=1 Tax=Cytobacillus oceanisediminis TaxID=665099 RepID=UPI00138FF7C6|nr:hypothetical protein [Cytobacillus oceanisediminis]